MIHLTRTAQDKLSQVLVANPEYKYVRLGVRGGGCSGFEYSIGLMSDYQPDWVEHIFDSPKIFVDQISMMYLDGIVVDYVESLTESGFKFFNPNVSSSCGCGKSFSM